MSKYDPLHEKSPIEVRYKGRFIYAVKGSTYCDDFLKALDLAFEAGKDIGQKKVQIEIKSILGIKNNRKDL